MSGTPNEFQAPKKEAKKKKSGKQPAKPASSSANDNKAAVCPPEKRSLRGLFSKNALKGHAKAIFNKTNLINFGAGAAAGYIIKAGVFAFIPATIPAIIVAGFGIGLFNVGLQRYKNISAYNKTHTDSPLRYFSKDILCASKTGHSWKHYAKKGAIASAFAIAGGLLVNVFYDGPAAAIDSGTETPPAEAPPVETNPPTDTTPGEGDNAGSTDNPDGGSDAPADPVVAPVTPAPAATSYTVVKGDNLWDIVQDHYKLSSNADIQIYTDAVAVANDLAEGTAANTVYPGHTLSLPATETMMADHKTLELDWKALDAETAARRAALALKP